MNSTISGLARPLDSDPGLLLNQVNIALKCLQLYPANHATTKLAIDKLWLLLAEYLNNHERLDFTVKRDALLIDGQTVAPKSAGIRSLALQLYRLKLDRLSIRADIDRAQLVDLLMIACMDPEDVFKAGGVKELLWQKQVGAVSVSQAFLKLDGPAVQVNRATPDAEKQAKLTAKAILSEDPLSEPGRQLIKRHLEEEPEQLSDFLETLGGAADGTGGPSAGYEKALPKVASVIERELAVEQASLYTNVVEALALLKEPVGNELAGILNDSGEGAIPAGSPDVGKIAARAMAPDQEGRDRIEKEIAQMNEAQVEKGALAALSAVLALEVDAPRLTRASQAIQRVLLTAFEKQRLGVAGAALAIVVNEIRRRPDEPDNRSVLKEIARDAGDRNKIATILSRLETVSNPSIDEAVDYITLIGNPGILTLLDMLALEKRQGRRLLLCRILTACGRADISGLGNKIMDHRWYLVRNVVFILGQIHDENAAIYLKKAASHPDPRVRRETAKAAANIGLSAMPVILSLLRDTNLDVQSEAIRAIANISHPRVFEILIGLVNRGDFFRRRVDVKIEAIRALGRLGAAQSIPHLNKIAGTRARFFKAQQARLAEAAAKALLGIEGRKNDD